MLKILEFGKHQTDRCFQPFNLFVSLKKKLVNKKAIKQKKEPPTISDNPKSPTTCQKSYKPAMGFQLEQTYDFVDRLQNKIDRNIYKCLETH